MLQVGVWSADLHNDHCDRTATVGGYCDWIVRRPERHVDLSQYTVRLGGRSTHRVRISWHLSSSDKHLMCVRKRRKGQIVKILPSYHNLCRIL